MKNTMFLKILQKKLGSPYKNTGISYKNTRLLRVIQPGSNAVSLYDYPIVRYRQYFFKCFEKSQ